MIQSSKHEGNTASKSGFKLPQNNATWLAQLPAHKTVEQEVVDFKTSQTKTQGLKMAEEKGQCCLCYKWVCLHMT